MTGRYSRPRNYDSQQLGHQEKRLRAGDSVWTDSSGEKLRHRKLADSTRADVVIVGAGVSGAYLRFR